MIMTYLPPVIPKSPAMIELMIRIDALNTARRANTDQNYARRIMIDDLKDVDRSPAQLQGFKSLWEISK